MTPPPPPLLPSCYGPALFKKEEITDYLRFNYNFSRILKPFLTLDHAESLVITRVYFWTRPFSYGFEKRNSMSVSLKRHVPIYSFIYHIRKIAVTEIRNKTAGNESLLEVECNCSLVFVHQKTITCIKRLLRTRLANFLRLNCNMWT